MYEVITLQRLDLQGVGLESLSGAKELVPNLAYLDVADNNLYSFDLIGDLSTLTDFVDLNLKDNPVCIHSDLRDEVVAQMPTLERFNGEQLRESGFKYRQAV